MKKLAIFFILFLFAAFLQAQSPQKFNYQGVARSAEGEVLSEQDISLRVSVLHDSPSGASQYVETHSLTTNLLGLFTASIGGGSTVSGNFANITWADGEKYLKIEIDPAGGSSYTLTGTFQLLSVPYSLQSRNTEQLQGYPVSPTPPDDEQVLVWDAGLEEWIPADAAQSIVYTAGAGISISAGNQISNTAPDQAVAITGTGATTVSGTYPSFTVNTPVPADNSATNELQILSINGNNISLSNGGGTVTLPPEVDGNVTNELQTISLVGNTLTLSNGGGSVTLNNGINYEEGAGIDITGNVISNTGDLEITNEIQTLSLDGNVLSLSNGGGEVTLNNGINYEEGVGIDITGNVISNTGDLETTNEIQTLSLDGNTLSLSNGGGEVVIPAGEVYTAGAGIAIDGNNEISNTGDLDPADDITNTTAAGGDLSGTYPNPEVTGIYGNPVSATLPGLGQVLQWNGDEWIPADPSTQSSAWSIYGNAGTDSLANFIGTTDDRPVMFRVFNTPAGKLSSDDGNIFLGLLAGQSNTLGTGNTGYGYQTLFHNTEGNSNTALGLQALYANTIGEANTANGFAALLSNTEGELNSAFGYGALLSNTIGELNTALGGQALFSNTEGNYNTGIGAQSLPNNTIGEGNTSVGVQALFSNTEGNYNTAVGLNALATTSTGSFNTAVGLETLFDNTIGEANTCIGLQSLTNNTTGNYNTATGVEALKANTTGSGNTANGIQALLSNTTGNNNTAIGVGANVSTGNLSNTTAIGNSATVNANNKIRLGNASITVIEGQVAYTHPSDGRFKFNVNENVKGLDFITRLRPVSYQFDTRQFEEFLTKDMSEEVRNKHFDDVDFAESSGIVHTGFIAQEVELAAREAGYTFDGVHVPVDANDNYSVAYSQFVVPLVKAVQEQQQIIEQQGKEIELLKAELQEIKALLQK